MPAKHAASWAGSRKRVSTTLSVSWWRPILRESGRVYRAPQPASPARLAIPRRHGRPIMRNSSCLDRIPLEIEKARSRDVIMPARGKLRVLHIVPAFFGANGGLYGGAERYA